MAINPRYKNGSLRRKHRARFKAMQAPCGICGGRLGAIHYDEPSDSRHPLSFVIDEIIPVSKWLQAGYNNAAEAAQDWNNLQPAHYICNQIKGGRLGYSLKAEDLMRAVSQKQKQHSKACAAHKPIVLDGNW